jgi:hypothetical protein
MAVGTSSNDSKKAWPSLLILVPFISTYYMSFCSNICTPNIQESGKYCTVLSFAFLTG